MMSAATAELQRDILNAIVAASGLTNAELRAVALAVSVAALPLPAGAATDAKLETLRLALAGTLSVSGPLTNAQLRAAAVAVSLASVPLPAGAATSTKQDSIIAALTGTLSVSGPLTDAQLRAAAVAVTLASLPLPNGASTSARQDSMIAALGVFQPRAKSSSSITAASTTSQQLFAVNTTRAKLMIQNLGTLADVYINIGQAAVVGGGNLKIVPGALVELTGTSGTVHVIAASGAPPIMAWEF